VSTYHNGRTASITDVTQVDVLAGLRHYTASLVLCAKLLSIVTTLGFSLSFFYVTAFSEKYGTPLLNEVRVPPYPL